MPTKLRPLLVFSLLLLAVAISQSQEDSEAVKVGTLEAKLMDAYRQRQIDAFASLLDHDLVITFEDGTTYGKIGYISYTSNPAVQVEVAEMPDLKVRMHGDTAILPGRTKRGSSTRQRVCPPIWSSRTAPDAACFSGWTHPGNSSMQLEIFNQSGVAVLESRLVFGVWE